MFLQQYYQASKSSHFIMLTLGISVLLHVLFVLFVQQEASSLQPGSASRISVAMHWSNNSAVDEAKKIAHNTSPKAIPEVSSKYVLNPISTPKVVETTKKTRPLARTSKADVPLAARPPIIETQIKPALVQNQVIESDIQHTKGQNLVLQENLKTESSGKKQLSSATAENQSRSQAKRYQIGSNNNPKPSYPSLAVKRGWQGQVVLGVHVNPDGTIEHLSFVKSTDYGVLNFEAYETVRTSWHFTPLEDESDPSKSSYIEVPITFSIANR